MSETKTTDLYLAAALLCKGAKIGKITKSSKKNSNQVEFTLVLVDGNIENLVMDYLNDQLLVEASSFRTKIVDLKERMFNASDSGS